MNTNTKYTLLLLSSLTSGLFAIDKDSKQSSPRPRFISMHEYFDRMFEDMQQSMQHMREAFAQDMQNVGGQAQEGISLSLEEKEKSVVITAKGLETESVDASLNDEGNHLLLKTAQENININSQDNYIAINLQHKQEKEHQNKDGKMEKVVSSYAEQSYSMGLSRPLDLNTEHLKIDYDKDSKTLTVEIPFVVIPEKKRTSIPVNIKTTQNPKK